MSTMQELRARALMLAHSKIRTVLGIVGPPGAGKSTLSALMAKECGTRAVLVPMDGFHLCPEELVRIGKRERMGAPDTFDVAGFACLLERIHHQNSEIIYAPQFDRTQEIPIAGAIAIDPKIPLVIVEGNYLLHSEDGWGKIAPLLDETWYIDIADSLRRQRLIDRRLSFGDTPEHARYWVKTVDDANAQLVENTRNKATMVISAS